MQPTRTEVLAILDTYEGMILAGNRAALAKWTEWKCVLARMEGR